jgi:GNAT superfamily N-acetyltransferase
MMLIRGMSELIIRIGEPSDIPAALELVKELALYERALQEVTNSEEAMLADGFGAQPAYGLFVAEKNQTIVGIAIHYVRYSTWKGKMLYLEDIVVKENERGNGIGKLLFEKCCAWAIEQSYAGMVWQVLDWNDPALNFYRKYNAQLDDEWINGKLSREELQKIINSKK